MKMKKNEDFELFILVSFSLETYSFVELVNFSIMNNRYFVNWYEAFRNFKSE
jgi:hypothetical protein